MMCNGHPTLDSKGRSVMRSASVFPIFDVRESEQLVLDSPGRSSPGREVRGTARIGCSSGVSIDRWACLRSEEEIMTGKKCKLFPLIKGLDFVQCQPLRRR